MQNELSRVVDALPGLVWTALPDGYVDFLNQRWFEYTGLSVDEARGQGWQAAIHPEDLSELLERWRFTLASGEPREMEARLRRFDGKYRWFLARTCPLTDASGEVVKWCGLNTDIDDRKRAEEALHTRWWLSSAGREHHFRSVGDGTQALASLLTPEGEVQLVNRHALEYFGATLEELKDRAAMADAVHPDDRPHVLAAWKAAVEAGRSYEVECRHRRADGVYRWFHMRGIPLRDTEERIVLWYLVQTDIDDRKRAEAMLAGENRLLELVASGRPLPIVLDSLCRLLDATAEGCSSSVLLLDRARKRVQQVVAPGLPSSYSKSLEGRAVSCIEGPCGMAVTLKKQVIVSDVVSDTRWNSQGWPALALAHGLKACWSTPILSLTGESLGTFAVYQSNRGSPTPFHQALIQRLTRIASIAFERAQTDAELKRSEAFLAEAQRLSSTGSFSWRVGTDEYTWSEQLYRIYEFDPGVPMTHELIGTRDIRWANERMDWALNPDGRDFEDDYQLQMPDGSVKHVHFVARATRDQDGQLEYIGAVQDVTQRRLAVDRLRASEARFRSLTELSSDWYWEQDENLRFTYLSSQAGALTGYSGESSLGKTRWEIANMTPLSCTWEEHKALLAARQPFRDLECRRVGADGTVRYLSMSGAPIFDEQGRFRGYHGIGRNITERKRIEEELRQSEERFALAVAGANEGIFDWDLVSDRVYVSYRAQELFGLPRGELWRPRRDWRHILVFHPDDAPRLHDSIKAHIEGGAPTYDEEFRIILPGGEVRWFRQRGIALRDASGKAYRMVGSIGDVTEKHKAEEELSRLERQLRLAQRLEAMGTLAGGIAHDFNNILGAILGFSEMAWRDAPNGSRLQRDLESIVTAGERGRALIDRILAFSRSAVGERVAVHVEKVVREALDLLSAKLPPSVTLSAQLRAGRAAMLGDPTQVYQVLMNLGTNAMQAMPSGGTLSVSLDAVRCEAARAATIGKVAAGDYVALRVADSGTGIAPEILERIFDPFFTTKEVGTGTGLGLSLVHGIVAELGGAIDVESTPGKGTAFTVHLPRTGEAADAGESEEAALPRGDGQRVLVVDDEEPLVQLATRTLEDLGYRPVGFTSSAAALAAFSAEPGRFDALIADERMPGLSGTALIREVRGVRRAIPILLMSGYVGGAVASLAREAGADDVLKKPVLARDLATSLARVLQQ